ncbi:MAG: PilZ domain-containing protein [Pseudomonadota bacterium]
MSERVNAAVTSPQIEDSVEETAGTEILFGRYMRPDRQEYPCQVGEIDASKIEVIAKHEVEFGEHIVAYLDQIGRIEGVVSQRHEGGFTISLSLSGTRLERFQKRLEWLNNRDENGESDQRRHARYQPSESESQLILPDGRNYPCEILDISVSGSSVKVGVIPSIGTYVMLGKMRGRVTRIHAEGIGIEFLKVLDTQGLKTSFSF